LCEFHYKYFSVSRVLDRARGYCVYIAEKTNLILCPVAEKEKDRRCGPTSSAREERS
jgi:hypothetical protein